MQAQTKWRCALLSFALSLLAAGPAAAAEEVMAVVQVMGYGYTVKVLVNGADIGVTGGKSEGRRLFTKDDPMGAKAPAEVRAKNFVLAPDVNEIVIEYAKIDPKRDDELEVTIEAKGYPQPLLKVVNRTKSREKITTKLAIGTKAPPGFKTLTFDESK